MKYSRYLSSVYEYSSTSGAMGRHGCGVTGTAAAEVLESVEAVLLWVFEMTEAGVFTSSLADDDSIHSTICLTVLRPLVLCAVASRLLVSRGDEVRLPRLAEKLPGMPLRSIFRFMMLWSEAWLLLRVVTESLDRMVAMAEMLGVLLCYSGM